VVLASRALSAWFAARAVLRGEWDLQASLAFLRSEVSPALLTGLITYTGFVAEVVLSSPLIGPVGEAATSRCTEPELGPDHSRGILNKPVHFLWQNSAWRWPSG